MDFKKIEKISVADTVYEQLKQMLLCGKWVCGEKIPGENQLAAQLGVSRVTVRDAIHRLIGAGVLTVRHGDGTYIADPILGPMQTRMVQQLLLSTPNLIEVLQLRMMLEVGAVSLAAKNAKPQDIVILQQLEQQIANAGTDIKEFAKKDLDYHNAISVISQNSLLVKIISIIQDVYASAMEETILLRGIENGRWNHRALTQAIAEHDSAKAEQLVKQHIQAVIDLINTSENS